MVSNSNNLIGKTLGTCRLEKLIGQGGMGVVYLAQQVRPARYVAVKVLLPNLTADSNVYKEFLARFQREANVIARLEHINIMPIYEYDEQDGITYLVMPYLPGGSLRDKLTRQPILPLRDTANYISQAASALDYAHNQGVIHRDLKPGNFLLHSDGRLVLADFGIARIMQESNNTSLSTLTSTGMMLGTPEYMAPEMFTGNLVDYRSDIYALGIILYQLLSGQVPFKGSTLYTIATKHLQDAPPLLRAIQPGLPFAIDEVIQTALAKKPEDRFKSAGALAQALRNTLNPAPENDILNLPTVITVPPPAPVVETMRVVNPTTDPTQLMSDPTRERLTPVSSDQPITPPVRPYVETKRGRMLAPRVKHWCSSNKKNLLLYVFLTIMGLSVLGVVLGAFGVLPPVVISIGVGLAIIIALVAAILAIPGNSFSGLWKSSKHLPVVLFSTVTLVIILVVYLLFLSPRTGLQINKGNTGTGVTGTTIITTPGLHPTVTQQITTTPGATATPTTQPTASPTAPPAAILSKGALLYSTASPGATSNTSGPCDNGGEQWVDYNKPIIQCQGTSTQISNPNNDPPDLVGIFLATLPTGQFTTSNYVIEAQLQQVPTSNADFGLYFRNQPGNQQGVYTLLIHPNGTWSAYVYNNTTAARTEIKNGSFGNAHALVTIDVVANGSNFTFYSNGQKLDSINDGNYLTGTVGIAVDAGGTVIASNFKLYAVA